MEPIPQGIAETAKMAGMPPSDWAIPAQVAAGGPCTVPLDVIRPSQYNPRTHFDEEAIAELAESIKAQGLIQPIVVRPVGRCEVVSGRSGGERAWFVVDHDLVAIVNGAAIGESVPGAEYAQRPYPTLEAAEAHAYALEVVAGERRWRACKLAGLREVPVLVRLLDDQAALEIAVVENLQRRDLDPFEEARGFELLTERGMSQAEIAERVNCKQSRISKTIGLLRLPEPVQAMIREGKLSPSHGQRLLPYAEFPEACAAMAEAAAEHGVTAAQLEKLDYRVLQGLTGKKAATYLYSYQAAFDVSACRTNCPHGAYRKPNGYEICFNPECYRKLDREAKKARKDREAAAQQSARAALELPVVNGKPAPEAAAAAAESIPRLQDLSEYTLCESKVAGCSDSCACRGRALDRNGSVVTVCLDRKRREQLVQESRKADEAKRTERVEGIRADVKAALETAWPEDGMPDSPKLRALVWALLSDRFTSSPTRVADALGRHGVVLTADQRNTLTKTHSVTKELQALIRDACSFGTLLMLAAEMDFDRTLDNHARWGYGLDDVNTFLRLAKGGKDAPDA